jgi:hypothetical protein
MSADPNGYLMRFRDGPMAEQTNVDTLAGRVVGNVVIPRETFGWPLPDRLGALPGVGNEYSAAFWDADNCDNLPHEIVGSPNAAIYKKLSESQLPDSFDGPDSRIMRGAEYQLEEIVL